MRLSEIDRGDTFGHRVLIGFISMVAKMRLPDAARVAFYHQAFMPLGLDQCCSGFDGMDVLRWLRPRAMIERGPRYRSYEIARSWPRAQAPWSRRRKNCS